MKNGRIQKLFFITAAFLMVIGVLSGCRSSKPESDPVTVRVGSLKGPTSMGLLHLMENAESDHADGRYEFTMALQADELLSRMVKKELDIALVPANVAGILYQNTEGMISVIDINTLGVLYLVTGNENIRAIDDLYHKTIYLTGKGTTPDYVLHYILEKNGLSDQDYTLEYRSEATEVAALLSENPDAVGLLPQPFATAACMQNATLLPVMDMNKEWEKLQGEEAGRMITGVTVVRKEFLENNEKAVSLFLKEHKESVDRINSDSVSGAELAVKAGIVAKEAIAQKAIPACNITYIDGQEMKQALSGYLEVLYGQNPESVGGLLPKEDFYYIP